MKRLSQSGSSNFCPELRKNALLISQSHFSNFALHVITFEIKSISKEVNCTEHKYMNMSPSLIELATPQFSPVSIYSKTIENKL